MKIHDVPLSDAAYADLQEFVRLTYVAMEYGVAVAHRFFELERLKLDPFLFAHITRTVARSKFELHGYESSIVTEYRPLGGLFLHVERYDIKILKAVDDMPEHPDGGGWLPLPKTRRGKEFYDQLPPQEQHRQVAFDNNFQIVEHVDADDEEPRWKCVVLWGLTGTRRLAPLTLVCPKTGGFTRWHVREHWRMPLPQVDIAAPRDMMHLEDDDERLGQLYRDAISSYGDILPDLDMNLKTDDEENSGMTGETHG